MSKFILMFMFLTLSGRGKNIINIDDLIGYEVCFESLNAQTMDHTIYIDEETRKSLFASIKRNDRYFTLPYEIINISSFNLIKISKI